MRNMIGWNRRAVIAWCIAGAISSVLSARPQRIIFPDDSSVVNVKTHCGARGDGIADDTRALQAGIDSSSARAASRSCIVYIPNGTYRITDMLVIGRDAKGSSKGPWLYGEHRDSVIIKLDDAAPACTTVLKCFNNKPKNADYFMRNIRNLTIDVGNHPTTDGIWYFSNNMGILQDVKVVGKGACGVRSTFGQNGPNLMQDVEIEGFKDGMISAWAWGQTLSRVKIRRCPERGLSVSANVVAAESLLVEDAVTPLECIYPNKWTWWCGLTALRASTLRGTGKSAIVNNGYFWGRNIVTGGGVALTSTTGLKKNVKGPDISEYSSHDPDGLYPDAPGQSLGLPVKSEPRIPWDTDTANWVCVNDYGAIYGDRKDDTEAFQKAFDAAAAAGKTTVYIRGISGGDPNWYNLSKEVYVHGSVRQVIGLGFARILGGSPKNEKYPFHLGRFVIDERSASVVSFRHIYVFAGPSNSLGFENRSLSKTMVVQSAGGVIIGTGGGDIFVTDAAVNVYLNKPGQRMWARQLNPEGEKEQGIVYNNGADLWVLGMKCEGAGIRVRTVNGGRTEILGMFNYSNVKIDSTDTRPIFDVRNASLSVTALREYAPSYRPFRRKVTEARGGETKFLIGPDKAHERWNSALISAYSPGAIKPAPTHIGTILPGASVAMPRTIIVRSFDVRGRLLVSHSGNNAFPAESRIVIPVVHSSSSRAILHINDK